MYLKSVAVINEMGTFSGFLGGRDAHHSANLANIYANVWLQCCCHSYPNCPGDSSTTEMRWSFWRPRAERARGFWV